ncbi:hypothetical protein BJF79_07770 [Actinomadura sp. CNU-125]|uniref:tetratricopeptide repeat protein n=1 Tax=Actinomadura sp. CNU-125 TaxID=1904961 RepID=UPI0009698644|nr:tetratricopeptide repeat protein [Actinomadura sp. CNU-125]OLT33788.1 hypothetical protein BJF79_07770 [Actinomadura sp. CNU-125]
MAWFTRRRGPDRHDPASMLEGAERALGLGRADAALGLLETAEEACRAAPAARLGLLLDVLRCKGEAQAAAGRGASAVLTLDEALTGYDAAAATGPLSPLFLDYGRALVVNADVLRRFGDPDLAVASADGAVRQYLNKSSEINSSVNGSTHIDRFRRATAIASELHAAGGRLHLALQVDDMAVQAAGPAGPARGPATARRAVHLRADGRAREADELIRELRRSWPEALAEAEATFAAPPRITLRQAIEKARAGLGKGALTYSLEAVLTDPGDKTAAGWMTSVRAPAKALPPAAPSSPARRRPWPPIAGTCRRTSRPSSRWRRTTCSPRPRPSRCRRCGTASAVRPGLGPRAAVAGARRPRRDGRGPRRRSGGLAARGGAAAPPRRLVDPGVAAVIEECHPFASGG